MTAKPSLEFRDTRTSASQAEKSELNPSWWVCHLDSFFSFFGLLRRLIFWETLGPLLLMEVFCFALFHWYVNTSSSSGAWRFPVLCHILTAFFYVGTHQYVMENWIGRMLTRSPWQWQCHADDSEAVWEEVDTSHSWDVGRRHAWPLIWVFPQRRGEITHLFALGWNPEMSSSRLWVCHDWKKRSPMCSKKKVTHWAFCYHSSRSG